MASNTTNEEYFETEPPLTEPHFVEEATVLSARPVVPLEEIQSEERSQKRLLFGVAIACSLALGALSAMFFYKNNGPDASTEITQAAPGAAGITVHAPVATIAESVAAAAAGIAPESEAETPPPTAAKKPLASLSQNSRVAAKKPKVSIPPQIEEPERNWDERFYERRRRRISDREATRESRRRQRRSADDLLRIRDIFEGPPRP
ncbi:MAG TPA: hypothetical protein VGO68_20230 [Pyrinomonadaceae bacterium]|jgi:hypothetical protein|nr:hypothetical protein [Pyrinomonadaceae bacterium]